MKNFDKNSLMTGYSVMTIFQKTGQGKFNKFRSRLFRSYVVVMILLGIATSVFGGTFMVRNETELFTVLDNIKNGVPGYADSNNKIILTDNVLVRDDYTVEVEGGHTLTIELGRYNFQGNGTINFEQTGTGLATVNIVGSTMAFGEGVVLKSHSPNVLKLNYEGMYTSSDTDHIGQLVVDDIIVDVTAPGSAWDAFNHDVIIGDEGKAEFNISNGNTAKSLNVIVGNLNDGSGILNIWGKGTKWENSDNFIVGDGGTGVYNASGKNELNLWGGAVFQTGNFAVGTKSGSNGVANIWGAGTILDIKGTNTADLTQLTNTGNGSLNVTQRAAVYLGYNDNLDDGATWGRLVLGNGTGFFDNSYFRIDRGIIDAPNNIITFQNGAMFEGSTRGINQANPEYSVNDGNVGALIESSLIFGNGAIFSPGYGSKTLWNRGTPVNFSEAGMVELYYLGKAADPFHPEDRTRIVDRKGYPLHVGRYGQNDITGNFTLGSGSVAIFDFDIQGANGHADYSVEHKDFVNVTGTAALDGHIHFRPMTGYYQNIVEIEFMEAGGFSGSPKWTLWPKRWFENPVVADGTLTMTRHETPFVSSAGSRNERSVGAALDWIYNDEHGKYVDDPLFVANDPTLGQEKTDWFPVLDWFWGMGDEEFREGLRQLSGETRAASFYMPLRSPWRFGFDRVNWRKRDNHVYFGQQNIRAPYLAKQDIWVTPYYDYMHMGNDGNTSRAFTTRVSFMTGYDRALSNYSAVGFLFCYSQPKLEQVYSQVIADDYLFGAHYHTRILNDFELKFWGSCGVQHYRLSRHVPIGDGEQVSARYKGNSLTGSVQVAKPYSFLKTGMIRPLAAIDYSFVQQKDASENGYHPIALNYSSSDWSQLFGRVGVRGDFGWSRFSLTSSLSYSYQIAGDVTPTATNQFQIGGPEFDIEGPNLSRTFINVGLGSQIYLNRLKSRMFFVQYNGNYGKRTNAQNASLGYQMTF